jgi:hypothetical protein
VIRLIAPIAHLAAGIRGYIDTVVLQLRSWSSRQWRVARRWALGSFLVMGVVGETLPGASWGRAVPVQWWNYVTLVFSPVLIGLCVATFVGSEPQISPLRHITGAGLGGVVGTVAMACPVCNPLAIPIFGAAGLLSFLAPERGLIALLSVLLLGVTLVLRLRAVGTCQVARHSPEEIDSSRVSGR